MKLVYPMSSDDYRGSLMAFSDDYDKAFPVLQENGFDGIELLVRDPDAVDIDKLDKFLAEYGLCIAAVGTSPMQKSDKLFLLSDDAKIRKEARKRCSGLIKLCAKYDVPLLIGKYRGDIDATKSGCTLEDLMHVLDDICAEAAKSGVKVLIEPQNASNINNINTFDDALLLISELKKDNLGILADIYHMDITEDSICESIKKAAGHIGFVHMSDSGRKVPGSGEIDIKAVMNCLDQSGYDGSISFEINQIPDSIAAACGCAEAIKELILSSR